MCQFSFRHFPVSFFLIKKVFALVFFSLDSLYSQHESKSNFYIGSWQLCITIVYIYMLSA